MSMATRKKWGRFFLWVFFLTYLVVLAYFLFFSERYGRGETREYHYNLELFREIKRYIAYRDQFGVEYFMVNIVGNVLAFLPFGFFVPILSPKNRKFFWVTLYGFEFSLMVELVQLSFQVGTFDVDDLFLNTIGSMLGYIAFLICKKRLKKYL